MARLPKGMRRRVDGTLEYRITYEGQRPGVYGKTVKECQEKMLKKIQAIKEHAYIKSGNITLDQYFNEWIERKRREVRAGDMTENTVRLFMYAYKKMSLALGKKKVKDIELREILKLKTVLHEKYSTSTTNKVMNLLHQLMRSAVLDEITTRNVCASIPTVKTKQTEKAARDTTHRALTQDEIDMFMEYAKGTWYFNMFRLLMATGMRAGEAGALKWRDIDRANNVIHIHTTVTKDIHGKDKIGKKTKTKTSARDIKLNGQIERILDDQRVDYVKLHGDKVQDINGSIFETEHMGVVGAANLTNAIGKIIKRANKNGANLAYFSSHAFRATFASMAMAEGMPVNMLKETLGHSSYEMTCDLYGHVYEDDKQEIMNKICIGNV